MPTTATSPASPLWTSTDRDRQRWQATALRLLDDVHDRGRRAGLVPLMWTLGGFGIGGQVSTTGTTPGAAEATLRAWADLLGLQVRRSEGITSHVRLYAMADDYGAGWAGITISVDLYDD